MYGIYLASPTIFLFISLLSFNSWSVQCSNFIGQNSDPLILDNF